MSPATSPRQHWVIGSSDPAATLTESAIAAATGCPIAIARLLVCRGIGTAEAAETFFHPALTQLHDPYLLLGMAAAVSRIWRALRAAEPILIYGDYDVDGTTATVLLKTAIEYIAARADPPGPPANVTYHVPHRIREGYGMQTNVLGLAASSGIGLVISVDTGIRAFSAADEAKALGLDLIVTDHHLPDASGIPEAVAVINPSQAGCCYPNKSLCGAGVAFKLAHALLATLPPEHARLDVLLPSFLKLVAIATIADSVPLTGENRSIVQIGLRELAHPVQPGLRALIEVAKLPTDRSPTPIEVGFRIAPRINAAGRMDIASDVVELFLTRDTVRARTLAEKLDRLNEDRRASEASALDAIDQQLANLRGPLGEFPADCIILDHPDWHRGVLGILASRVVERTGRPALILTHHDGEAHGSGRSIPGFHLLDAITAVHVQSSTRSRTDPQAAPPTEPDPIFLRFGGHAYAVGFSLPSSRLPLLRARMTAHAGLLLTAPLLAGELACDAELSFAAITPHLYQWLDRCAPFGAGNSEPIFLSRRVTLAAPVRIIKEKHICLQLHQPGNDPAASSTRLGKTLSALGWSRTIDWAALCTSLNLKPGSAIDIAYHLRSNTSNTLPTLELELVDMQPCSGAE